MWSLLASNSWVKSNKLTLNTGLNLNTCKLMTAKVLFTLTKDFTAMSFLYT